MKYLNLNNIEIRNIKITDLQELIKLSEKVLKKYIPNTKETPERPEINIKNIERAIKRLKLVVKILKNTREKAGN